VIETALTDLWYGFGVALQPHNLMWCFIGVLVGNMVGVLPGMGPLATISILLPLTFGIKPVGAILMLAGVMYGAQYGGAICSILLNLPCHPPHAVTCLDGFPMTKQGRGGVALGLTVMASFVGASWGITEMIFLSPILVRVALEFGPAEICSLMLLGLLAGSTLAREQIKNLPHPGVIFRPVVTAAKAEYWIAWHSENHSKALGQYIEVVKKQAATLR